MKADSVKISKVFSSGGDVHYFLPHFQREFAWEKENWKTLLEDIFSLYEEYNSENEPEHFLGALVVINDGTRNATVPAFKLVDGQQRLTTISLVFCVLAQAIKESHPFLYKKIRKLLVNEDESGLLRYKLLPTPKYGDRTTFFALVDEKPVLPSESKIYPAYEFIQKEITHRIASKKIDPEQLFVVLNNCLQVVFIDLDQRERPYEIFESLNAKGKALSQADLVRNYIAMRLPEKKQALVFEELWSPIETMLQEKRTVGRSGLGELTAFLRHYLSLLASTLISERHVYDRFRDRIENQFPNPELFTDEISALKNYAEYYNRLLRPDTEPDRDIQQKLKRLNTLEIATAYPFLIAIYNSLQANEITRGDFLSTLDILENYLLRRYLAGEQTNFTNKMFTSLAREINFRNFIPSLKQVLVTKNYPGDHRLRQKLQTESLYDKRQNTREKTILVLQTINQHLSRKNQSGAFTVLDGDPTIEHIMPQNLTEDWRHMLGENWYQVHDNYLNTLGNLTLVTGDWNSSLSNANFSIKKQKMMGHGLLINHQYFASSLQTWNEVAIQQRTQFLADQLIEIYPAIGEPPAAKAVYGKPKNLIFLGETIPVSTWRDVAYYTAERVSQFSDDFDAIARQIPSYFSEREFQTACRKLSNGWWLYVNLSGHSVKGLCANLLELSGLPDTEWELEEE